MPKPRRLTAVREREGNPSKEPIPQGVRLPPHAPPEPDWIEFFPAVRLGKRPPKTGPPRPRKLPADADEMMVAAYAQAHLAWVIESMDHRQAHREYAERRRLRAEAVRARMVARRTWCRIVPWLDSQGMLADIDQDQLAAYCVGQARIEQGERDITLRGLNVPGDRGMVKNGSVTIVNNYREKNRPLVADFGLTPLARDKINPRDPDGPGGGSPFDV